MPEPRKPFLLRLPPDLWDQLNRLAQADLRSVNAQIEYMLRDGVRRRGREKATGEGQDEQSRLRKQAELEP